MLHLNRYHERANYLIKTPILQFAMSLLFSNSKKLAKVEK
jgi:hypothetical protein